MDVAPRSPEEIFPLEVWGLILDNLGSVTDLKNCNLTCKAWKELLLRKRTTFLMPKVFPILYKYLLVKDENKIDQPCDSEETWMRYNRKPTEVLKMRLVSTTWKESVDAYYQNYYVFNDTNFVEKAVEEQDDLKYRPFVLLPYHFKKANISKLESFLENDFPPDMNPFITRYVNYDDGDHQGIRLKQQLRNNFKKLLESFGMHIWNCVLTFAGSTKVVELYKLLRKYISLMPNLRSLDIFITDYSFRYAENKVVARSFRFSKLLKNEPFPKLGQLVQLHLGTVPHPICVEILAQNEQLRNLSVNCNYEMERAFPDPLVEQLVFFSEEGQYLLQLQKFTWPLKALRLTLRERTRWANIFKAVSPFRDSLEHLIINLNWPWKERESRGLGRLKDLRFELPKLKKFKLEAPVCITTIDFLADCTALQDIELWIDNDHIMVEADDIAREGDEEVIQFESCITSMHKSNVWTILSALQLLKIDTNGLDRVLHPQTAPNSRVTRRHHEKYAKGLKGAAQE